MNTCDPFPSKISASVWWSKGKVSMDKQMDVDREFRFLLDKIKRNRNTDFSRYRPQTLKRRIRQRMHYSGCAGYWDYITLLNKDPEEYDRLIETLTIKVSEFFRNPSVFQLLSDIIVPGIVSQKRAQGIKKIRAWSCGTAFGQEAYSMAILFCEILGRDLGGFDVKILATDIDKHALEEAPWGSYERTSLDTIQPHILFKYFTRLNDRYVVNDRPKDLVTFRRHNIVSDNSVAGIDLVLCRNLLIYFQQELQEIAVYNLHTALNPNGILVLGKTETIIPQMHDIFEVVDLRERIYRKKWALNKSETYMSQDSNYLKWG